MRLRGGARPSVPPGSTGPQRSAWPKRVCLAFCALLRPALSGEQRAAVGPWAGVGEERLSPDPRRPCPPTPSLTAAGHLLEAALQVSGCGAVKSWAQECGSVRGPVLCCVPDGCQDETLPSRIGRRASGRSVFLGKETSGLRQPPPCLLETWVSGARPRLCPLVPVEEINRCLGQGCWPRPRWGLAPRTLSASPWSRSPRVPAALLLPASSVGL